MKKWTVFVIMIMVLFSVVLATSDDEDYDYIIDENYDYNLGYGENDEIPQEDDTVYENVMMRGKVIEATEPYDYQDMYSDMSLPYQDLKVRITDKRMKGTVLSIQYCLSYYADNIMIADPVNVGDYVYVYANLEDGEMVGEPYIAYVDKQNPILWLMAIYALAIILIGGMKGFKALVSLVITILAIFLFMIPQIFQGTNALLVTIITSIFVTMVSLFLISGFHKKTWAAIIGTISGIVVAAVFAIGFGSAMKLSGVSEESYMLTTADVDVKFDFKGIMFSGILIGALGACMDVGMSLASAMEELKKESPDISRTRLWKAGMNIGKDMMGTMTNTLILAYVGSSTCCILLFMGFHFEMFEIINQEKIAEEIVRALAGSLGLICTIPLTALVSSILLGGNRKNELKENEDGRETSK